MGRLSYSDLLSAHFRNIGKYNQTSDAALLADFQYNLGQRYQLILASLESYVNQEASSITTVASTQYYDYPIGIVSLDSATVTVNSVVYPVTTIYDQSLWDWLNAITVQPTTFPQFIFPRKDDFGFWPTPQDAYTVAFNAFQRDRNLLVADYTTGTVTLTNADATVTGSSTVFTAGMVGRWFEITDTSVAGHGEWYRVDSFTSTTSIELHRTWSATTISSGEEYRIGESPEIPPEGHSILAAGTAADFYAGLRNDITKATWWNNIFWTGDGNNNTRDYDEERVKGGLIGLVNRYKSRDRSVIINRKPQARSPHSKIWGTVLS